MFEHIVRADHQLLLLNTLQLMLIAFLPFPTAILARALHFGANEPIATSFYSGVLTIIGVLVTVTWRYAAHDHRLLSESLSPDQAKSNGRRFLVGPVGYGIGTVVALIAPWLALVIYVALNVFFLWPRRVSTASIDAG